MNLERGQVQSCTPLRSCIQLALPLSILRVLFLIYEAAVNALLVCTSNVGICYVRVFQIYNAILQTTQCFELYTMYLGVALWSRDDTLSCFLIASCFRHIKSVWLCVKALRCGVGGAEKSLQEFRQNLLVFAYLKLKV